MMEDKKSEVLNNFLSQYLLEIFFLTPLRWMDFKTEIEEAKTLWL